VRTRPKVNGQRCQQATAIGHNGVADLLDPGITVMSQDPLRMGMEAAELLFERLDGADGPSRHRLIETKLVTRGSGEIRPAVVEDTAA
jgi:DNA-binding LacI/PurR family transcriptional regulator